MNLPFLKDKAALLKHSLSLLASLVIHAVFLYFMATHFVSVKLLDFKEQVTDILIAPRPRLEAPKIEGPLPELPSSEADLLFGIPTRRRPAPLATITEGQTEALTGHPEEPAGGAGLEPRFTEGFRLDSRSGAEALPSQERLRLTIPERQPTAPGTKSTVIPGPRAGDLRKYVYSSPGGSFGFSGRSGPRRPGAMPSQLRVVPPSVLRIDLSPWARKAVEAIQKNWHLPLFIASSAGLAVEVVIVVLKTGEITRIEIVTASEEHDFDLAAREAVEMSSPLPPLPSEFPAASLELTLIFAKQ